MRTNPGSPVGEGAADLSDDLGQRINAQSQWGFQEGGLAQRAGGWAVNLFGTKHATQVALGNEFKKRLGLGMIDNALDTARYQGRADVAHDFISRYRQVDPETGQPREGWLNDEEASNLPGLASIMNRPGSSRAFVVQEGRSDRARADLDDLKKKHKDLMDTFEAYKAANPEGGSSPSDSDSGPVIDPIKQAGVNKGKRTEKRTRAKKAVSKVAGTAVAAVADAATEGALTEATPAIAEGTAKVVEKGLDAAGKAVAKKRASKKTTTSTASDNNDDTVNAEAKAPLINPKSVKKK